MPRFIKRRFSKNSKRVLELSSIAPELRVRLRLFRLGLGFSLRVATFTESRFNELGFTELVLVNRRLLNEVLVNRHVANLS